MMRIFDFPLVHIGEKGSCHRLPISQRLRKHNSVSAENENTNVRRNLDSVVGFDANEHVQRSWDQSILRTAYELPAQLIAEVKNSNK